LRKKQDQLLKTVRLLSRRTVFVLTSLLRQLAQDYQRFYRQALFEHAKSESPFQIAHGQIAIRLHKFPKLVHDSEDSFRQVNSAVMWQELKKVKYRPYEELGGVARASCRRPQGVSRV
jgi:hypothetical protein